MVFPLESVILLIHVGSLNTPSFSIAANADAISTVVTPFVSPPSDAAG